MFAGSPYSPFFTSGLYRDSDQPPQPPAFTNPFTSSTAVLPSSSSSWLEDDEDDEDVYVDAPRRGSLPTSTHTHTTAATTSYNGYKRNRASSRTGSSFYFSLQPSRDEKEFRSFLSLDLAESASLASAASLRRKASQSTPATRVITPPSPKMTTSAKRLSLSSRRVPSPKPAPSVSLPSIPLPSAPSPSPMASRVPSPSRVALPKLRSAAPSPRPSRAPTPLAPAPPSPSSASSATAPRLPSISIPKITLSVSLEPPVLPSSSRLSTSAPSTSSPISVYSQPSVSREMRISRTPTPTATGAAMVPPSARKLSLKKKTHVRTSTLSTVSTRARRLNRSVALDRLEGRSSAGSTPTPPPPASSQSASSSSTPSSSRLFVQPTAPLDKPTSAPPSIAHFSLRRNFMSLSDDESDSSSDEEDLDDVGARSDYSDDEEDKSHGRGRADFFELGGMWLQAEDDEAVLPALPTPEKEKLQSEWMTITTGGTRSRSGTLDTKHSKGGVSVSMSMALGHHTSGILGHARLESTSTTASASAYVQDRDMRERGTSFQARPFTHSTGGMKSGHKPSTRRRFRGRESARSPLKSFIDLTGTGRGVNTESYGTSGTGTSGSPAVHRHPVSLGSLNSSSYSPPPNHDSNRFTRSTTGGDPPPMRHSRMSSLSMNLNLNSLALEVGLNGLTVSPTLPESPGSPGRSEGGWNVGRWPRSFIDVASL